MNQSFSENASKNTTKKCFVLPIISFFFFSPSCLNDAGTFPPHRSSELPSWRGGGNDSQEHWASPVTPHLSRPSSKIVLSFIRSRPSSYITQLSGLINGTAKLHKFILMCAVALTWALETAELLFSIVQTDIILVSYFFSFK